METRRGRRLGAIVLIMGLCALSACAPPSLREAGEAAGVLRSPPAFEDDPVLAFLAGAEDGESAEVLESATGLRIRVTAGRRYHAASGSVCRRFNAGSAAAPERREDGLACRVASGRWTRVEPLSRVPP